MNTTLPAWQQAEADADYIREQERPARHLARMRAAERRERRFWPIAAPLIIAGLVTLAAGIQGGAI